jgi:hypothetical protein
VCIAAVPRMCTRRIDVLEHFAAEMGDQAIRVASHGRSARAQAHRDPDGTEKGGTVTAACFHEPQFGKKYERLARK